MGPRGQHQVGSGGFVYWGGAVGKIVFNSGTVRMFQAVHIFLRLLLKLHLFPVEEKQVLIIVN